MATPNPNEPKSVSMIIKQRQQSRSSTIAPKPGGGKNAGAGARSINESLNPILPPLYPPGTKPAALDPEVVNTVKVYNKLAHYFKSNFSPEVEKKSNGFHVQRYTDQYKSALALKSHLSHRLPDSCFPDELVKKTALRKPLAPKMTKKLEDLPDVDEEEKPPAPRKDEEEDEEKEEGKEETNLDDVDNLDEDMDEEMDIDTDYNLSYFDNGEGDEDDRDDEDGPTCWANDEDDDMKERNEEVNLDYIVNLDEDMDEEMAIDTDYILLYFENGEEDEVYRNDEDYPM